MKTDASESPITLAKIPPAPIVESHPGLHGRSLVFPDVRRSHVRGEGAAGQPRGRSARVAGAGRGWRERGGDGGAAARLHSALEDSRSATN